MSSLSFQSFVDRAREDAGDGTIRIARGTETELVNKGTFGNALSTLFRNIGEWITGDKEGTRDQRTRDALTHFQTALTAQFGDTLANDALRLAGLTDTQGQIRQDVKLTGAKVIEVSDRVWNLKRENIQHNNLMLEECLPPSYAFTGGSIWEEACRKLGVDSNPFKTLSPEKLEAYGERLKGALRSESTMNQKALPREDCIRVATATLKQVLKLDRTQGQLERAQVARANLCDAMYDLLARIGRNSSPQKVFDSLVNVQRRTGELLEAEQLREAGQDDITVMQNEALYLAMIDLQIDSDGLLDQARVNVHGERSPARGLVTSMNELLEEPSRSDYQSREAYGLTGILTSIVVALGTLRGTHTVSPQEDGNRLHDPAGLRSSTLDRSREAMRSYFEDLKTDPTGADVFLGYVKGLDPQDALESKEVLSRLESEMQRHRNRQNVSLEQGGLDFLEAIKRDDGLSRDLKDKLSNAILGILSENVVRDRVRGVPALRNMALQDMWRLTTGGERQDDPNFDKWTEENERSGSLDRMQSAFQFTLGTLGKALSTDLLQGLYRSVRHELPPWSDETKTNIDGVLGRYREDIGNAVGEEAKLAVIARTIRGLHGLQLLGEDGGEILLVNLLNRLLLENDLPLSILQNPEIPPGEDFDQKIIEGRARFGQLTDVGRAQLRAISEGVPGLYDDSDTEPRWSDEDLLLFVNSRIEHCEEREGLSHDQAVATMRATVESDPGLHPQAKARLLDLLPA